MVGRLLLNLSMELSVLPILGSGFTIFKLSGESISGKYICQIDSTNLLKVVTIMMDDTANSPAEWTEEYRIKFQHLAPGGKADPMELLGFTQETAWRHAEHLGIGYSSLEEANLIFALSWESITLQDRPRYGDAIEVHTSLAGMTRLYFYRDFVITDADSEVLLKAHTAWVSLDVNSRRPQRLDRMTEEFDFPPLDEPSGREKPDLTLPENGWRGYTDSVSLSHLDASYHANNIQYVRWMADGLPMEFFSSHELEDFDIEYRGELHPGDELLVETNEEGTTIYHRIIRKGDGSEVARARSNWTSIGKRAPENYESGDTLSRG